jgi:hypothetical protein
MLFSVVMAVFDKSQPVKMLTWMTFAGRNNEGTKVNLHLAGCLRVFGSRAE